jgi:hypothetical protein
LPAVILGLRIDRKHADLAHALVDLQDGRDEANYLPVYVCDPDFCLTISQNLLDVLPLLTTPVVAVEALEDLVPPLRLSPIRTPEPKRGGIGGPHRARQSRDRSG